MKEEEIEQKAQEHWIFLERWMHKIFVAAFTHGWKHGVDSCKPLTDSTCKESEADR